MLAAQPARRVGLGEIAATLGLNPGTCANILKTLVDCGLVDQPDRKKGYRLGPKIFQWAGDAAYMEHLVGPAREVMAALREAVGENVILAILRGGERLVLREEQAAHELQARRTHVKSAYEASTGRLMLAFMDAEERGKFIVAYGLPSAAVWPEAATRERLEAELAGIRAQGLAMQTAPTHVMGLAVPVKKDGKVVASLGIYLPEIRADKTKVAKLKKELAKAAAELSGRLGTGAGT
jgi:DNA-binding IclR family transcriptional regulator